MDAYRNLAYSLIDVAPEPPDSGTHVRVRMAYPDTMPPVPFNATVWPINTMPTALNAEIVRVTGQAGGDLTILRAQEGTQAMVLQVGDQLAATITKKLLDDMRSDSIQPPPSGSGLPNHLASFADTTGKLLKDSGVLVDTNVGATRMTLASSVTGPQLYLRDNASPVDARVWRISNIGQIFYVQSLNDADTASNASLQYARTGKLLVDAGLTGNACQVILQGDAAALTFNDRAGAADAKRWKWQAYGGSLTLYSINDPDTVVLGTMMSMNRSGDVTVPRLVAQGPATTAYGTVHLESPGFNEVRLLVTDAPVNQRIWRMLNYQNNLQFWASNDGVASTASAIIFDRIGRIQLGQQTSSPALRPGGADSLEVVSGDNARFAQVMAGNFYAQGGGNSFLDLTVRGGTSFQGGVTATTVYTTAGGSSMADLTVRGGTNFQNGVTVTAGDISVAAGGYNIKGGFIYPTNVVDYQNQLSWYLSAHSSYSGLYTNGWFTAQGNVNSIGYVYPGQYGGGFQQSWFLCSHGSYGLFTNTGLYVTGPVWMDSFAARGPSSIGGNLTITAGGATISGNTVCNYVEINVSGLNVTAGGASITGYTSINTPGGSGDSSLFLINPVSTKTKAYRLMSYDGVFRIWNGDNNAELFTMGGVGNGGIAGLFGSNGWLGRYGIGGGQQGNAFNFIIDPNGPGIFVDVSFQGYFSLWSDARLKRDFVPLTGSLDKIRQLRPGSFYYRHIGPDGDMQHLGLLAQDVLAVAPELVQRMTFPSPLAPDGPLKVNYLEMIPMLVDAIQELDRKLERLHG